jgi:hypothetical protein
VQFVILWVVLFVFLSSHEFVDLWSFGVNLTVFALVFSGKLTNMHCSALPMEGWPLETLWGHVRQCQEEKFGRCFQVVYAHLNFYLCFFWEFTHLCVTFVFAVPKNEVCTKKFGILTVFIIFQCFVLFPLTNELSFEAVHHQNYWPAILTQNDAKMALWNSVELRF